MKVALVHNWPGTRNAEFDLIGRMQRVLSEGGHGSTVCDPFGNVLDVDAHLVIGGSPIDGSGFDFCLYLHFSNPHLLDCPGYAVNWNPVGFLLRHPIHGTPASDREMAFLTSCLASVDVVVSAGSAEADHLVAALAGRAEPAQAFPDLRLHTSCPLEPGIEPVTLDDFRVFYIGMNWERTGGKQHADKRHGGLLEWLDRSGRVDFYGVRKLGGIEPWKGFQNYKGELPFDGGHTVIQTANRCGVTLVLSSPQHRESGVVSMRIFQGCAARSVIISDDNRFIIEHFGDAVLTFEYSSDPATSFERIMTLITWIEQHPQEASEKADRAHRIFTERFSMDSELDNLLARHQATMTRVNQQLLPGDTRQMVDVVFNLGAVPLEDLQGFVGNLNKQRLVTPHGIVCGPHSRMAAIQEYLGQRAAFPFTVCPVSDSAQKGGIAVRAAVTQHGTGDAFCIYQPGSIWHGNHLAVLLGTLQRGDALVAQTHPFIRNRELRRHGYNIHLCQMGIGEEPSLVQPAHLAGRRVSDFSPCAFLFRRELLLGALQRNVEIDLFDEGAALYLVSLNYMLHGALPSGTSRITFRIERDDDLLSVFDMNDPGIRDRLDMEAVLLGSLFRDLPRRHELAHRSAAFGESGADSHRAGAGGMYGCLIKVLHHRPVLRRMAIASYNAARYVRGLPPNPPRKSVKKDC